MMEFIQTGQGLAVDVVVKLPHGLHSRPSARLAQAARDFDCGVFIHSEDGQADAKSMLDVLSLAVKRNDRVRLVASGPQAEEALAALGAILEGRGEWPAP